MRIGLVVGLVALASQLARAEPPFSGTIFIDPDIITAADPTTFLGAPYAGQGVRTMFDRRVNNWITVNAFLFNASFSDGLAAEIQVNPEFGSSAAASTQAQKFGAVIGRLPTSLRADVQTVWIHQGTEPFGGGNNNLLIHTGQSAAYEADGILEETFVHEASHTSLDATHKSAAGWLAAQAADGEYISTYARDYPTGEDVAESFLPYLAVRYRSNRISASLANTILQTIPNRIAYFDALTLDLFPVTARLGDFNGDQVIDGGDFLAWQRGESPHPLDASDLSAWKARFGTGAISAAGHAVPEPVCGWLAPAATATVSLWRRRSRKHW